MPERNHKGDFTLAGTTLTFPRSFHKECNGFMRIGTAMGSTLQQKRKCTRFTCFRREDSRKYLNERIFVRDVTVL